MRARGLHTAPERAAKRAPVRVELLYPLVQTRGDGDAAQRGARASSKSPKIIKALSGVLLSGAAYPGRRTPDRKTPFRKTPDRGWSRNGAPMTP